MRCIKCLICLILLIAFALCARLSRADYTNSLPGGALYVKHAGTVVLISDMADSTTSVDEARVAFVATIIVSNGAGGVITNAVWRERMYPAIDLLGTNAYTNVVELLLRKPVP